MITCVAVVYDPETLKVHQIVVPDYDRELDDPAWTNHGQFRMCRIPASFYFSAPGRISGLQSVLAEFEHKMGEASL